MGLDSRFSLFTRAILFILLKNVQLSYSLKNIGTITSTHLRTFRKWAKIKIKTLGKQLIKIGKFWIKFL